MNSFSSASQNALAAYARVCASFAAFADSTDLFQNTVRIYGVGQLQEYAASAVSDSNVGNAVDSLTICLPRDLDYPVQPLRQCLQAIPNVVVLVLLLPSTSPTTILDNVQLRSLAIFVANLPHRVVEPFLESHRATIDSSTL